MMSNFDFSLPQRQSLIGVIVLFVNGLQKSIKGLWPLFLIFFFKEDPYKPVYVYGGIVLLILLIAFVSFLKFWYFKFYIDSKIEEFVIENGIFNKTKITIPFHKIQKVSIDQSLIQRIFSVYKLELDTAGSDGKEVSIAAISHKMAVELKSHLLENSNKKTSQINEAFAQENQIKTFINISLPSLLKIGFTANYLSSFAYLILAFSTISENLKQIGQDNLINDNINQLEQYSVTSLLFGVLLFLFIAIIIMNLVLTVFKYFNFTIKREKNAFVLSYGLLHIKSAMIHPEKVQIIKLTQNFFQKKLDVNSIEIFQASSSIKRATAKDKTKIPGSNALEKQQIIKLLLGKTPNYHKTLYPNIRKLLIEVLFIVVIPVLIGIILNLFLNKFSLLKVTITSTLYVVIMGTLLFLSYKKYRLFISDEFIKKQSGVWDVHQEIIMPHKIQAIETHQFFWQKRTNIGSFVLYTAGGTISFSTSNFSEIKNQVNKWLYQVEVSKQNWM
ncbi:PH domain-containing protein [uncultured Flavobacterium sp.]|uniref:PH domain-containing protein n=1 Tax=uncultured Flavobacterium sp. TaxID=165435 RepID=UPI0030CA2123